VLAGSTAYAVAEGRKWPVGLAREPKQAIAFYTVLVISGVAWIALDFAPIDPIKALYWSAVINGVIAAPIMVVVMILARSHAVMGSLAIGGWLHWFGWASTAAMGLCVIGVGVSLLA
jgi:Mn2+/Fe2+ NRAMP family transporter